MTYDSEVLADSPLLYWKLDEVSGATAVDSSGGGYHGGYVNGPTLGGSGPVSCHGVDHAAFFPGDTVGANTAKSVYRSSSPLSGAGDFTVEMWVRPSGDAFSRGFPRQYMVLLQQRSTPVVDLDPGMLRVVSYNGSIQGFGVRLGATTLITAGVAPLAARAGCWSHLAVRRSGSTVQVLLNGSVVLTGASSENISSQNLSVAADYVDATSNYSTDEETEQFRGYIAKVALYNSWLSDARIAARVDLGCRECRQGWLVGAVG